MLRRADNQVAAHGKLSRPNCTTTRPIHSKTRTSPSKQFLRLHRDDPKVNRFAELAFGHRPKVELYDLRNDPDQFRNVADDPAYAKIKRRLSKQLESELINGGDPRLGDRNTPH